MAEVASQVQTNVRKKVAVSGAFDPFHIGHLDLLEAAAKFGDLYVILKGDRRLMRKKAYILMPALDRKRLLEAFKIVKEVYVYDSEESLHHDDFSEALRYLKPDIYCGGADKEKQAERPEVIRACEELNIEMKFCVGGMKIRSSHELLSDIYKTWRGWETT